MKKLTTLTLVVIGLVLASGLVVAMGPGTGFGNGTGPAVSPADRPMDGSNSPWLTADDDRLDRFQERFQLTDQQMNEIRETVRAKFADGADRDEVRATVQEMLASYGVDDTTLGPHGPMGDGPHRGGHGFGNGMQLRDGSGAGSGPHGANGNCQ
ncbi:hypothetical protein [Haladaptatus sp. NG-WS-4]